MTEQPLIAAVKKIPGSDRLFPVRWPIGGIVIRIAKSSAHGRKYAGT